MLLSHHAEKSICQQPSYHKIITPESDMCELCGEMSTFTQALRHFYHVMYFGMLCVVTGELKQSNTEMWKPVEILL